MGFLPVRHYTLVLVIWQGSIVKLHFEVLLHLHIVITQLLLIYCQILICGKQFKRLGTYLLTLCCEACNVSFSFIANCVGFRCIKWNCGQVYYVKSVLMQVGQTMIVILFTATEQNIQQMDAWVKQSKPFICNHCAAIKKCDTNNVILANILTWQSTMMKIFDFLRFSSRVKFKFAY